MIRNFFISAVLFLLIFNPAAAQNGKEDDCCSGLSRAALGQRAVPDSNADKNGGQAGAAVGQAGAAVGQADTAVGQAGAVVGQAAAAVGQTGTSGANGSGTGDQDRKAGQNEVTDLNNMSDQNRMAGPAAHQEEMDPLVAGTPEGMVLVRGGMATIGSNSGLPAERPVFTTRVESFYMDKHPVTVAQFREFVKETGHVTYSEEIGDGIIFDHEQARWVIEPGVYWEYPLGKGSDKAPDDHPVTLLTYDDALAYLEWAGKRLPTEVEWEHAARGVSNREHPYAWGEHLVVDGKFMANTWTGRFPYKNEGHDGYILTSPVGIFGETETGLTDMGGNVWEWTSDWFRPYSQRNTPYEPRPDSEKAIRGGSFMCNISYCHGYRVSARSHTPPDNNMFHIGFRGVRDVE